MEGPKLRLWAKLIQSGHHESYDLPPQIPLITGSPTPSQPKKKSFAEVLSGAASTIAKAINPPSTIVSPARSTTNQGNVVNNISPMKTTAIRRSCLEDLKKLKDLNEDCVLTDEEFDGEKHQILVTLKNLTHKENTQV